MGSVTKRCDKYIKDEAETYINKLNKELPKKAYVNDTNNYIYKQKDIKMIERQELHCHACGKYVQFDLDLSLNGNHVLKCPECDHEHCRVVKNGKITDDRWDQRNGQTYQVYMGSAATSTNSVDYMCSSSTPFLATLWIQSTCTTA